MPRPFFPDPLFGWAFYAVLVALLIAAAYTDLRRRIIPKQLTLVSLGLGLLFNLVRGAWLGAVGDPGWLMGGSVNAGLVDALVFTLAGFGVGFMLFFVMWVLGTCGGGDVKLFAALGAWVGPLLTVYLLLGTIILVVLLSVSRLGSRFLTRGLNPTLRAFAATEAAVAGPSAGVQGFAEARRTRQRLMAYSLPVLLATAAILLWEFRNELRLAPALTSAHAQALVHP
jgi:prepilin peptidase CpaA